MNMVVARAMRHVRVAFMGPGVGPAYGLVAVHYRSQLLQPPASQTPDKIIITTDDKTIGALLQRILPNIHLALARSKDACRRVADLPGSVPGFFFWRDANS
jgi:hypothetical protein